MKIVLRVMKIHLRVMKILLGVRVIKNENSP